MHIRTPLRITFFGGGTDYREWFELNGGSTLSAAIQQYTTVELIHTSEGVFYPEAKRCAELLGYKEPFSLKCSSTLPSESGLGSSSSFTISILSALHGGCASKQCLIDEALQIESSNCGVQDQYTCALGGIVSLDMSRQGIKAQKLTDVSMSRSQVLQQSLLLVHTGVRRRASDPASEKIKEIKAGRFQAELTQMRNIARFGVELLQSTQPLVKFGELLEQTWQLKKLITWIDPEVKKVHQIGREAGAIGGKLLGAGVGGFMLFFVEQRYRTAVKLALSDYMQVPIIFDWAGTHSSS